MNLVIAMPGFLFSLFFLLTPFGLFAAEVGVPFHIPTYNDIIGQKRGAPAKVIPPSYLNNQRTRARKRKKNLPIPTEKTPQKEEGILWIHYADTNAKVPDSAKPMEVFTPQFPEWTERIRAGVIGRELERKAATQAEQDALRAERKSARHTPRNTKSIYWFIQPGFIPYNLDGRTLFKDLALSYNALIGLGYFVSPNYMPILIIDYEFVDRKTNTGHDYKGNYLGIGIAHRVPLQKGKYPFFLYADTRMYYNFSYRQAQLLRLSGNSSPRDQWIPTLTGGVGKELYTHFYMILSYEILQWELSPFSNNLNLSLGFSF